MMVNQLNSVKKIHYEIKQINSEIKKSNSALIDSEITTRIKRVLKTLHDFPEYPVGNPSLLRSLNRLSSRLATRNVELDNSVNQAIGRMQPFPLMQFPPDILRLILQKLPSLRTIRIVCKALRQLSGDRMVYQVNTQNMPLRKLGLTAGGLDLLLHKLGDRLTYLNLAGLYKEFYPILEFMKLSPNVKYANLGSIGLSSKEVSNLTALNFTQLESLNLSGVFWDRNSTQVVVRSNLVSNLKKLDLSCNKIDNPGFQAIVTSPHLTQLEELHLRRNKIHFRNYEPSETFLPLPAILSSLNLPRLKLLDISENHLDNEGLLALTAVTQLTQLECLDVGSARLTSVGVQALVSSCSKSFPLLRNLNLSGNPIDAQGVKVLADYDLSLESLNLAMCGTSNEGLRILAKSKNSTNLKQLELGSNAIDEAGIQVLAGSELLTQLVRLSLNINRLDSLAAITLCAAFKRTENPRMKELNLGNNSIGNIGAIALANAHTLKLNKLNIRGNKIDKKGFVALVGSSIFLNLRELICGHNLIGDEGVTALSKVQLPQLEVLDLAQTAITSTGVRALVKTKNLPRLANLFLQFNTIGKKGFKAIAKASHIPLEELNLSSTNAGYEGAMALLGLARSLNLHTLLFKENNLNPESMVILRKAFGERVILL